MDAPCFPAPARRALVGAAVTTLGFFDASDLRAQAPPPRGPALTSRDLLTLGVATAAAGVLVPFDARIARWSQQPTLRRSRTVNAVAAAARTFGDPGTVVLGGATYGVGLLADRRATAAVGLHALGAVAAGGVVTGVIKSAVGRARPFVTHDSAAFDLGFGRGLRRGNDYQSFPSGHATAAFAFASALAAEGRHRWSSLNRTTGPAGFAVAGLVAASRVYHDRHWASDVVAGAGIGTVAGAAVVRYTRSHPRNAVERRLLPGRSVAPAPVVSWTVRF
jgi:membrane-associated phospholipid phosphatase